MNNSENQEMLNKVLKGLECCTFILGKRKCDLCPYAKGPDRGPECYNLMRDVRALLKAQEPHLLTKDDFNDNPNMDEQGFLPVWREYKDNDIFDGWDCVQIYSIARQGDGCRMWTSKPSDELMKKVKWE